MADIFNKEALEALDEHGEAEEMARVASPKLRLVLGAMVAMIIVVAYWCIFGTINYKVTAQGVVFPFSEVTPIKVPYEGVVSRSLVNPGNNVVFGGGIVEIRNALSASTVTAPRDGVVISTLPIGTLFNAGDPVAWLLPQTQQMAGKEMLCYVTYNDVRKLKVGQQVQATPANMQRENWGYAFGKVVGIEQFPTTRQEIISRVKLDPLAAFIPDGEAMSCRYCTPHCPMQLDIPGLLKIYNDYKYERRWSKNALSAFEADKLPSNCIGCGSCAEYCPQSIDIPSFMKKLANLNETGKEL